MGKIIKLVLCVVVVAVAYCVYSSQKTGKSIVDEGLELKHKADTVANIVSKTMHDVSDAVK